MKKWFFAATAVLALSLAGCGSNDSNKSADTSNNTKQDKVLVMGTAADYAPFEYIDAKVSDDIIGFDVDLAKAVTDKMGYKLQVKDMEFNSLIPALQAKKVDFVLAGMTPNAERDKVVDFSQSYYDTKEYMLTKKGSGIKADADLAGKKVGAQTSSIQEDLAKSLAKQIKGITLSSRDRIPELVQEVKLGRIDALITEDIVAENYLKQNKDLEYYVIQNQEDQSKAAAFPEGSKLTAEFDKAYDELKKEGKVDELKAKWFKMK
ncbi:transporter substrate-binding domain-containing protein [Rummeliibacillus sp. JY-2-4R]